MSEQVSVTEVRNALRCPRIFALGKLEAKVVAFPVGSSCLGATFHRLAERFAQGINEPPTNFAALGSGAALDEVETALRRWVLNLLRDELGADGGYQSIPAEVDDLAEALREYSRHLAGRIIAMDTTPADALRQVIQSGERQVAASWPDGPLVRGRLDALYADASGELEVIEYKLTDEANSELDQCQAVLYQQLLKLSDGLEARATVLRFTPTLRETTFGDPQAIADKKLAPTLRKMLLWAQSPETAPPTERRDLCAACPVSEPCSRHYPTRLALRDDPPVGATRPRNAGNGEALTPTASGRPSDPLQDEEGPREARQIRDLIIDALRKLGASAESPAEPAVGPRTYVMTLSRKHGSVAILDRAAQDVQHRLASEHNLDVTYEKANGHRRFWVTRQKPRALYLGPMLEAKAAWLSAKPGRFIVGQEPGGKIIAGDFSDGSTAHLLVAGQTGSGKSVFLQALLASLVRFHGPDALRFSLVDPKRVTFTGATFRSSISPHLDGPISHDSEETLPIISQLVELMEERYRLFDQAQVTDIEDFNESSNSGSLERRILVIDEFQDLLTDKTLAKEFCQGVARLGAKARAAGIHLVLATQRPSRETLPTIIKANLGGRIAFQVGSAVDSRIILDRGGAETLLGKGDLYANLGRGLVRAQGALLGPE